ncbi:MAG: hypothetical protein M0C28_03675 [Candidatus Moduliflexus flocculans]|nr:hypothetical protein [Candidatus Moduliflexus flocculans]
MRKAVAVCLALFCWGNLSASPEGAGGTAAGNRRGFALAEADGQNSSGFSLMGRNERIIPVTVAALDPHSIGVTITPGLVPEIEARITTNDSPAPLSVSVFLGRANGDLFSTLHEQYAWRTKFKSLTLGAGIYRDIPIYKALRIQPYVGIVRTRALLRPSDLGGNSESYEYRLTAFCVGLPLVCGF